MLNMSLIPICYLFINDVVLTLWNYQPETNTELFIYFFLQNLIVGDRAAHNGDILLLKKSCFKNIIKAINNQQISVTSVQFSQKCVI